MNAPVSGPVRVLWSGVRSTSHVVYAASWLRSVLESTEDLVTLVDLGRGGFLEREPISEVDLDRLLPTDSRLRRVRATGSGDLRAREGECRVYLSTGAPGIKPFFRMVVAQPTSPVRVVVTDEGIGSYGSWQSRRAALLRQGGTEPWSTFRAAAVATASRLATSERWSLYRRHGDRWELVEEVAAEFRRYSGDSRLARAVFLSQPWVELGVIDERRYVETIRLVRIAVEANSLELVVRPHPAESPGRYRDFTVLEGSMPAEVDQRVNAASVAIGADSTALLNLRSLFGTQSVRLSLPDLKRVDQGLSSRQRSLLRFYLGEALPLEQLSARLATLGGH